MTISSRGRCAKIGVRIYSRLYKNEMIKLKREVEEEDDDEEEEEEQSVNRGRANYRKRDRLD